MKYLFICLLLVACGGGNVSDDTPPWSQEEEAEIQELLEIVNELGRLYNRNE